MGKVNAEEQTDSGNPQGSTIAKRQTGYNQTRPHSALGKLTALQYRLEGEQELQTRGGKIDPLGHTNLMAVSK